MPPLWPAAAAASEPLVKVPSGLRPAWLYSQAVSTSLQPDQRRRKTYLELTLLRPARRVQTPKMPSLLRSLGALGERPVGIATRARGRLVLDLQRPVSPNGDDALEGELKE